MLVANAFGEVGEALEFFSAKPAIDLYAKKMTTLPRDAPELKDVVESATRLHATVE